MSASWTEQAVLLGPRKSLVGVITKPSNAAGDGDRPMFVFLNSGIIHHVGANRRSVQLARTLAALGYSCVRFDLSGIGDSEPRTDALEPTLAAKADIREALDSLEATRNVRRFVLLGLCSGANYAAIYAGEDERVVGAILLEPTIPPPLRHYAHHYARRLGRVRTLAAAVALTREGAAKLRRMTAARTKRLGERPDDSGPQITDAEIRTFLEATYRRLLERRVPFLVVLTGESWYYRESFFDGFPKLRFGDTVELEYLENADHTFTSRNSEATVTRRIVDWAQRTLSPGSSAWHMNKERSASSPTNGSEGSQSEGSSSRTKATSSGFVRPKVL